MIKVGNLTFHVEGEANDYKVIMTETKPNGKTDRRENNFNAKQFIDGTRSRERSIKNFQEKVKQVNEILALEKKPKNFKELGEQFMNVLMDEFKMPPRTQFDADLKKCEDEIKSSKAFINTQKEVITANKENTELVSDLEDKIKKKEGYVSAVNKRLEEIKKVKAFYTPPKNEQEFLDYMNLYFKTKFRIDRKGLMQAKNVHEKDLKEQKALLKEQMKVYPKAIAWLEKNDVEEYKKLFPNDKK